MNAESWLQINTIVNYASHDATVASLAKLIDQHEKNVEKKTAKKCREIAQQRYLAKNQAVKISAKIAGEFNLK